MSKVGSPKRIRVEDFSQDDQQLVQKIAGVFNDAIDEIYANLTGKLDFNNLNRQIRTFTVKTDTSGVVVNPPEIKYTTSTKPVGLNVINLINNTDSTYPLNIPVISTTITTQNTLRILNISGLPTGAARQYTFTVEIIGS